MARQKAFRISKQKLTSIFSSSNKTLLHQKNLPDVAFFAKVFFLFINFDPKEHLLPRFFPGLCSGRLMALAV